MSHRISIGPLAYGQGEVSAYHGPGTQRPYLYPMPLTLTLPQERSEDLFRALFGKSRGVPQHLLPIDPQIFSTDELDRSLRSFATRHTSTFRSDDGEWL